MHTNNTNLNLGNFNISYRSQSSSNCTERRDCDPGIQLYTFKKAIMSGSVRHLNIVSHDKITSKEILTYLYNNFLLPSGI